MIASTKEVALYCMPNKKWLPPFSDLDCVQPCERNNLADGFCDCKDNNERCQYDGGDCCVKPPERKKVKYLLRNSPRCSCIDPLVLGKYTSARNTDGSGSDPELQVGSISYPVTSDSQV